jgi:hypothetical protein
MQNALLPHTWQLWDFSCLKRWMVTCSCAPHSWLRCCVDYQELFPQQQVALVILLSKPASGCTLTHHPQCRSASNLSMWKIKDSQSFVCSLCLLLALACSCLHEHVLCGKCGAAAGAVQECRNLVGITKYLLLNMRQHYFRCQPCYRFLLGVI